MRIDNISLFLSNSVPDRDNPPAGLNAGRDECIISSG
jgi:hypothetical protein